MAFKKYSNNPEDWFRICDECKVKYPCKTYNSFAGFQKKIELGEPIRCNSCAQTGKEMSDEFKEKCRNRVFTEEQRKANGDMNRARYANMTPEEKEEVSRIQKQANQKRWEGKEEEKKLYFKNFNELARNISPEKREEKKRKISEANKKPNSLRNNPETWRLPCSGCDSEISFEKYHRFQNAKSGVKKGHDLFCSECKEKKKVGSDLYKDSWVIECFDEECKTIIEYGNYPAYKSAIARIEAGAPKYCNHCRETKYPKKDGAKKKYSNNPEDWKIKCKFDDCERILTYNFYGAYAHNCKRILKGDPPMCYSCAAKQADRGKQYSTHTLGRPNYNKRSISYIENVLNEQYQTIFKHAESEKGEQFLYDSELRRYYFADAYSKELNLWIEIDEKYHFDDGILQEECQFRHQRIKKILNCDIVRIKFIVNQGSIEYFEYHNDLKQITGFN